MAEYFSEEIENQTVVLDGGKFTNCDIHDCVLTFGGGDIPELAGNTIRNCDFRLVGPAGQGLLFLSVAYNALGGGEWVEGIFDDIRRGLPGM